MAEPFLAEIVMFGGNFNPRGWAFCNGQLLPISQNSALFSLLGTTFGGDGRTTFGLPELRGRVAIHPGTGPGLSAYILGQKGGVENVTLNTAQIPSHNHTPILEVERGAPQSGLSGAGNMLAAGAGIYTTFDASDEIPANAGAIKSNDVGGGQSHTNIQPFQCVNFIIALQGVYPSRN